MGRWQGVSLLAGQALSCTGASRPVVPSALGLLF